MSGVDFNLTIGAIIGLNWLVTILQTIDDIAQLKNIGFGDRVNWSYRKTAFNISAFSTFLRATGFY